MTDYITDTNLSDAEVRVMVVISRMLKDDKSYIMATNGEIADILGKNKSAISKSVFLLSKKGYIKAENPYTQRKLHILK